MKKLLLVIALLFLASPAFAGAEVGQPAPDFTGKDTMGREQHLADYKGKIVVLEWSNPGCPYVQKHYETGNMQTLQNEEIKKGVVWLTVVSSSKGREGYMSADEANDYMKKVGSTPTARILDSSGEIGKLYGATATPHMFVIDKDGVLQYAGAIDDRPSADHDTVAGAHNYVHAAIDELEAGKPVDTSMTQVYGCSIKYAD
ncbi:MAG TPA: thioredoxin family protein [Patescibacteria group bacterium]|nr:thioredoxin family protein [Patescibacteria group bacterium]